LLLSCQQGFLPAAAGSETLAARGQTGSKRRSTAIATASAASVRTTSARIARNQAPGWWFQRGLPLLGCESTETRACGSCVSTVESWRATFQTACWSLSFAVEAMPAKPQPELDVKLSW